MKLFNTNISDSVFLFLKKEISSLKTIETANELLQNECGIENFFLTETEVLQLSEELGKETEHEISEPMLEYGDFQTNQLLASRIVNKLKLNGISPQILIEPTCGKGNFILAALDIFDDIEKIYGIEIQKKYVWHAKFAILDFFLNRPNRTRPSIQIINTSIFTFDYDSVKDMIKGKELLIIGNPPWVTNSMLGAIKSSNLPKKTNFKQYKGIDSITGKSNFDIAENITLELLRNFGSYEGIMAFLVKNTVVKNIVYDLPKLKLSIANMEKQNIDSKKEFNVNVDASLFLCQFNKNVEYFCRESDFYTSEIKCDFGWLNGKFMSDLSCLNSTLDGVSPFEWRQGVKHDCSKIMEIENNGDFYTNKLGEQFFVEDNLLFPLLKSSDLKSQNAVQTRKMIIITQRFVGQDTAYLKKFPHTFSYLNSHIDLFRMRKSSIYKGKSDFSIFGIGEYSFKPYKIAISGLYKTFHFCLVKPQNNKPVMLDDTCYFIGFDTLEQAEFVWKLLNTEYVRDFLKSISFSDSKRMITKDILMRIDLLKLVTLLKEDISFFNNVVKLQKSQLSLFD